AAAQEATRTEQVYGGTIQTTEDLNPARSGFGAEAAKANSADEAVEVYLREVRTASKLSPSTPQNDGTIRTLQAALDEAKRAKDAGKNRAESAAAAHSAAVSERNKAETEKNQAAGAAKDVQRLADDTARMQQARFDTANQVADHIIAETAKEAEIAVAGAG